MRADGVVVARREIPDRVLERYGLYTPMPRIHGTPVAVSVRVACFNAYNAHNTHQKENRRGKYGPLGQKHTLSTHTGTHNQITKVKKVKRSNIRKYS